MTLAMPNYVLTGYQGNKVLNSISRCLIQVIKFSLKNSNRLETCKKFSARRYDKVLEATGENHFTQSIPFFKSACVFSSSEFFFGTKLCSQVANGGRLTRIDSVLPPLSRPNFVPLS
jgi:hypothetical protein